MPDLTIEYMQQCQRGHDGDIFTINGHQVHLARDERTMAVCDCLAFKYSKSLPKNCKHIVEADKLLCDYHEQIDGPPAALGICPKCGGPTVSVRVAV